MDSGACMHKASVQSSAMYELGVMAYEYNPLNLDQKFKTILGYIVGWRPSLKKTNKPTNKKPHKVIFVFLPNSELQIN